MATKPLPTAIDLNISEAVPCSLETLTCTLSTAQAPFEALAPYDEIEMRITVDVEPGAKSSEPNGVRIPVAKASSVCRDPE